MTSARRLRELCPGCRNSLARHQGLSNVDGSAAGTAEITVGPAAATDMHRDAAGGPSSAGWVGATAAGVLCVVPMRPSSS